MRKEHRSLFGSSRKSVLKPRVWMLRKMRFWLQQSSFCKLLLEQCVAVSLIVRVLLRPHNNFRLYLMHVYFHFFSFSQVLRLVLKLYSVPWFPPSVLILRWLRRELIDLWLDAKLDPSMLPWIRPVRIFTVLFACTLTLLFFIRMFDRNFHTLFRNKNRRSG